MSCRCPIKLDVKCPRHFDDPGWFRASRGQYSKPSSQNFRKTCTKEGPNSSFVRHFARHGAPQAALLAEVHLSAAKK